MKEFLTLVFTYFAKAKQKKKVLMSWYVVYFIIANCILYNIIYVVLIKAIYYPGAFRGEIFSLVSVVFICAICIIIKDIGTKFLRYFGRIENI